jgi:hypothetical protein
MGKIDKSFVSNQVVDRDLFNAKDECAVGDVFIKDRSGFFILSIGENSLLRWLHFDLEVFVFLQDDFNVLGDERGSSLPDAFVLSTDADEVSLLHDIFNYTRRITQSYI